MRTLFQLLGFLAMTYAMLAPAGELLAKDSKGKSGSRAGKSSGSRAAKSSGSRAGKSSSSRAGKSSGSRAKTSSRYSAGKSSSSRTKSLRSDHSDRQRSVSSPVRKKSSESPRSHAKHDHDRDRTSSLRRSTSDRHDDDRHSGSRHSLSHRRHDDDHHDRDRHHSGHHDRHGTRHRSSLHFGFSYPWYGSYGRSYYSPGYSTRYRYGSDYGLYGYPDYYYGTPYLDSGPAETGFYGAETPSDPALARGEFQRRAEAAFRSGQYQEAVRWANHAVVESPDSGRHFLFLSQTLFAVGNFQAATEAAYRATELLPPDDWGYVVKNYARFYRDNAYVTQMSRLTRLMKDQPDAAFARALRGYHYAYLGYKDPARRDLAKALELDAKDPLARRLSEQFGWTSPSEFPSEESPPGPANSPPGAEAGAAEPPASGGEDPTLTNSAPPADSQ